MKKRSMLVACAIIVSTAIIVSASYTVWNHTFTTEIKEPFDVVIIKELPDTIYPCTLTWAEYEVHSSGRVIHLTATAIWPEGSSDDDITIHATIYYIDSEGTELDVITETDYDGTETFTLYADDMAPDGKSSHVRITITVYANPDAPSGTLNIPVKILRG